MIALNITEDQRKALLDAISERMYVLKASIDYFNEHPERQKLRAYMIINDTDIKDLYNLKGIFNTLMEE